VSAVTGVGEGPERPVRAGDEGPERPVRAGGARVPRFGRAERIVHWCSATLFLVLIGTGAAL
jgi:hypothetical protein